MGLDAYFLAKFKNDDVVDGEKFPIFNDYEDSPLAGYREVAYYRKSWNLQDWISRNVQNLDYDTYYVSVPIEQLKKLYFEVWNLMVDSYNGIDISDNDLTADPYATIFNYENDLRQILEMSDDIEDVIYYGSW